MDARIILAGQQPNLINVLAQSGAAAQQQNEITRQNALLGLYQQQGPGILAGDPNAMNALAQFDPAQALNIQGARQDMTIQQQKMDMLSREEKRALEDRAAQMTAQERAAAAAQVEDAVKMGMAIQSPEQWDQVMASEAPDLVGQFANREALAAKYMSMAEILKQRAGPEYRPATAEEAAVYGAAGGQINDRTGKFDPINPPSTMAMQVNPDGTTTLMQGAGAGKAFTEAQSKDIGFATRMRGAEEALRPVETALTNFGDQMLNADPTGAVRGSMQSIDYQLARQAGQEWLLAFLRKDSGAATTKDEDALYGETFLPRPGDSPEVIEQKRASRERAMAGVEAGMSPVQALAKERALQRSAETTAATKKTAAPPVPQGVNADQWPQIWDMMTPEQRALFE